MSVELMRKFTGIEDIKSVMVCRQFSQLIILFCVDDSISKAEYDKYVALGKYDRVSVDWHKEANKDLCLEELFYNRTDISELPPILKPLKELLDTHTETFKYAWFGED